MYRNEQVENYVARRIYTLEAMKDPGSQKAAYAQLRRGVGSRPGDIPQMWGILFRDLPEDMMSADGDPSPEEWAISTALTMYAFHQQSHDPAQESMNRKGWGIGKALAELMTGDEDETRVQRRFNCFATASDMAEAVTHLRGIVGLLKNKAIGLDYAKLAGELYDFQDYEGAKRVRLIWGQDFYMNMQRENKEETEHE